MTPEQKTLVQNSWREVAPIADVAARLFYGRLFKIDPSTRKLFAGVDLERQQKKLIGALSMTVGNLERVEALVPTLEDLGRRHVGYGVTSEHYDSVGAALLWTLSEGLGDRWNSEVEAAWTAAYTLIAGTMRGAAEAANRDAQPSARAVA